jgi:hypothetical protein
VSDPETSRRRFIQAATGAWIVAAAGGNYALAMRDISGVVGAILDRRLGPFVMAPEARAGAIARALEDVRAVGASETSAWALNILYPLIWAAEALPEPLAQRIEKFERQVVTSFLMSTTYLQLADPATEAVAFDPAPALCSPFARL